MWQKYKFTIDTYCNNNLEIEFAGQYIVAIASQRKMQSLKQSVGDLAIDGQRSSNSDHQRRNVRNLLTVSMDEKRRFMQSFDDILTDCDGKVIDVFLNQ